MIELIKEMAETSVTYFVAQDEDGKEILLPKKLLLHLIGEVERLQYERGLLKLTLHTEIQNENKELQKENEALRRSLTTEAVKNSENALLNQELQKALEHYADWVDWEDDDMGKVARTALQSIQGGDKE